MCLNAYYSLLYFSLRTIILFHCHNKVGSVLYMYTDSSSDSEHDVPYFRQLLCTETNRLTGLSDHWNIINEDPSLTEEG